MTVVRVPHPGERWQFRHWSVIGAVRGGVTVDEVVDRVDQWSGRVSVVVFRYDSGGTGELELPAFCASYVHTPDLPVLASRHRSGVGS